jgi:hypothetical protein
MNWKLIIVGAIVFWLVSNILGMAVTGPLIHEKILDAEYKANLSFWLPELREDPPDMGALLPKWLLNSFLISLVVAGIYSCVHDAFSGSGLKKGFIWGLSMGIFSWALMNSYAGVFDLPSKIWLWWGIDGMIMFTISGAVMGWAGEKFGGG